MKVKGMPSAKRTDSLSVWSPLAFPHFRLLWVGMSLSTTAFWMQNIAVTWLMREWTGGDAIMISLVQTALFLPVVLLSLVAGALADLFDRRRFLMFSQLWMMSAPLAVAVLVLIGIQSPMALLATTVLLAVGNAMKLPSQAAYVPSLVDKAHLPFAIGLNSMAVNGGRILGPALAGGLLPLIGGVTLFIGNSAIYLIYVLILTRLPNALKKSDLGQRPFTRSMRELFAYAGRTKPYRTILWRGGLYYCVWSTILVIVPLIAADAREFGFLYGIFGAGAVFGASFYGSLSRIASRSMSLNIGIGLHALCIGALAMADGLPALSVLMALIGVCSFFIMTTLQVSLQLQLPDELRGRGLSLMTTVFMAGTALSSPVWGVLVDMLDSRRVLFGAAVFSLTCVVLFYKTKVDPPEPANLV